MRRSLILVGAWASGAVGCALGTSSDNTAAAELLVNQLDLALTFVGVCGAAVAFVIGLRQYKRAEQWKRAEFIAAEMKD
jgi:hypothetical protein